MDAVIYAAQISSSFFSSLAIAVEGFLDLFIDSNSDNSGNDDDTRAACQRRSDAFKAYGVALQHCGGSVARMQQCKTRFSDLG